MPLLTRKYDRKLGIKTAGLREWEGHSHYNRYEATPYEALEILFQSHKIGHHSRVVDFGCGRGRVLFYIHKRFRIPVVGIEANEKTYHEALQNKISYRLRAKHIAAPILLEYGLAEHYQVQPEDTCFYFFNPFSSRVFSKVLSNIMASVEQVPRTIELILFYPLPEYEEIVSQYPFQEINRISVPGSNDPFDMFIIYRLLEETAREIADYSAAVDM